MNAFRIYPSNLKGAITLPSSKSHTLRALLFALMAKGKSTIHSPLHSPDTEALLKAISYLGGKAVVHSDLIEVEGVNRQLAPAENVLDVGNSGILLRFLGGMVSLSSSYTVLTGDHSIRHIRLAAPLLDGLSQLGVFAKSSRCDGFAPLIIRGPLKGGTAEIDGEESQPVSALLMAASFGEYPTHLKVRNPGEKPWIDLTCKWLDFLGLSYERKGYDEYFVPGRSECAKFTYHVPGDLSSFAFPLVAALITDSAITIHNVDLNDSQGDKKILSILESMGGKWKIDEKKKTLQVQPGKTLRGGVIDLNGCVDALPILAVAACFAEGKTVLENVKIARAKECDRIHAIACELKKMGADIDEKEDGLVIRPASLEGAELDSHHDHRMGLALSVAALKAKGESVVRGVSCFRKTFPHFKKQFALLGAKIEETK